MIAVSTRAFVVALFASLFAGCHRPTAWRASSFSITDPTISRQLISGFYASENGWRWAGPTFTFALPPPARTGPDPLKPAKLTLSLFFPPNEIDQLGPITITATGSDYQFGKATYDKPGPYDFVVEIPPEALCTNVLPVTFSLDKYLHGSNADVRDLGVVVNRISLRN
ncbi:MAG: hypothetical protein ACJ746_21300 [Bryobacteraceae bacterium]